MSSGVLRYQNQKQRIPKSKQWKNIDSISSGQLQDEEDEAFSVATIDGEEGSCISQNQALIRPLNCTTLVVLFLCLLVLLVELVVLAQNQQ